jgi:hypothetical protein
MYLGHTVTLASLYGGAQERLADLEENSKTRGRPGASGTKPEREDK